MSETEIPTTEREYTVRPGHVLVATVAVLLGVAAVTTIDSTLGPSLDPGPAPRGWTAWRGDGFAIALPPTFDVTTDLDDLQTLGPGTGLLVGAQSVDEDEDPELGVVVLEMPGTAAGIIAEAAADDSPRAPTVGERQIGSTTIPYLMSREGNGTSVLYLVEGAGSLFGVMVRTEDDATDYYPMTWGEPIVGSLVS